MPSSKTIVISLGGSIISPQFGKININFLKKFRKLILKFLKKGFKFIIIVGGGKTCRLYQSAASKIIKLPNDDRDWLGIHTARLNSHLLRTIFRKAAYPVILDDPEKPVKNNWELLIASGWQPGWSTDYIAVLLAKRFKIKELINAGDVPFVYDKDPDKYKNAKPFKKISWSGFRKIVGSRWSPGLSAPFDPIAAKLAERLKIRVFILKGTELKNFEKVISGKNFKGTIIE
ncbi:MAG: UMP kinase [Candidatus Nealsonbacteria bacterium CG23_combo_of_CG06-09_8_20_14_all_36_12]|uniref:Uridylate kinase n=2 Tax=Candidatus Nealsoniibacteriota TaxID=1817911 RepID=A0A2H0TLT1_9BACT|nr:MAG: UMP kinase [Candidatus Nealsonbacteria bacterium CG23_combo_of_CG06-09_8_20_14_all_36_12]PIR73110.1 MAG: UMP kinase [Candidatus Nealsonbacteria bacterium CG10_big_fil_rev_8_21_14_0_10_36_23]